MKRKSTFIAALLLTIASLLPRLTYSQWQTYPFAPTNSVLNFPTDDGYHAASTTQTEWWYINMHVIGSAPAYKEYDVMLVYFRFYNMRIFNISEGSGSFHANVAQLTPTLTFKPDKWDLKYTLAGQISDSSYSTFATSNIPYQYVFHAEQPSKGDALDVMVTSNRTPLVVGADGYVPIGGQGDSSFYYSYSNMKVKGKIKFNGVTDSITSGIAWIDRQYGPFTVGINSGNKYEWYSLQVDKPGTVLGTPQTPSEYNVWQIYSGNTSIPYKPEWRLVSGLFPDNTQDTSSTYLFERKGYWRDPAGGKYYSNGWRIIDPKHGVNIDMTPTVANQIIDVTAFKFWEGGTKLKGTVNNEPVEGFGFAELVAAYNTEIIVPSVPDGLTIIPHPNHVSLSWTASTAGTYPIGGYRVYRSATNDGYWQYLASTTNLTYNDSSVISGENYYYTVSSFDNQTATSASAYASTVTTGILTIEPKSDIFNVFPNPSEGVFELQFKQHYNIDIIDNIEVYNVLGEKTFAVNNIKQLSSYKIDISDAPKGVYFIKIYTANGCYLEKIMKQ